MKTLVSGSSGFIGGYVVEELLRRGHEVIGIDNFSKYGKVEKSYDDNPALDEPGELVDLPRVITAVGHRDDNDRRLCDVNAVANRISRSATEVVDDRTNCRLRSCVVGLDDRNRRVLGKVDDDEDFADQRDCLEQPVEHRHDVRTLVVGRDHDRNPGRADHPRLGCPGLGGRHGQPSRPMMFQTSAIGLTVTMDAYSGCGVATIRTSA